MYIGEYLMYDHWKQEDDTRNYKIKHKAHRHVLGNNALYRGAHLKLPISHTWIFLFTIDLFNKPFSHVAVSSRARHLLLSCHKTVSTTCKRACEVIACTRRTRF